MQPDPNQQPNTNGYNQAPTPNTQPVPPSQQPQVIAPSYQSNAPAPNPQTTPLQPSLGTSPPLMNSPMQQPQVVGGNFSNAPQTAQKQPSKRRNLIIIGFIALVVIGSIALQIVAHKKTVTGSNESSLNNTSSSSEASSSGLTYKDPKYGFTLQLPKGWQEDTKDTSESAGEFFFLDSSNPSSEQTTGIFVNPQTNTPSNESLSDFANTSQQESGTLLSSKQETFDGDPAILDTSQLTSGSNTVNYYNLYVQASSSTYYYVSGGWGKNYTSESTAIEAAVNSFKP